MTIQEKKDKLLDIMTNYYPAFKLANNDISLEINEKDYDVYDPWDWNNPDCYSVCIFNNQNKEYIKGCINLKDGECVLDLKQIHISGLYIKKVYDKYKDDKNKIRTGHVRIDNHFKCEAELCFINYHLFFVVLEKYLQLS